MAKWPDPASEFEPAFDEKPGFAPDADFEPLELKKPLARGKASDLGDVTSIADALADLGAYDKGKHGNPPLAPETLFRAIEDFQKDQGLDVDGVMLPSGPTLGRINALLPKARPRRVRGELLQSERPAHQTSSARPFPQPDGMHLSRAIRARPGDHLGASQSETFGPSSLARTAIPLASRISADLSALNAGSSRNLGAAAGDVGRPSRAPSQAPPQPPQRSANRRSDCELQAVRDEMTCRRLTNVIRVNCWQSVQARYGACITGRPLPPLITW